MIEHLHEQTSLSKKDISEILKELIAAVKVTVLENGKEIRLRDFGTFKQKKNLARKGRNPQTGETMDIPSSTTLSFHASKSLKLKEE